MLSIWCEWSGLFSRYFTSQPSKQPSDEAEWHNEISFYFYTKEIKNYGKRRKHLQEKRWKMGRSL